MDLESRVLGLWVQCRGGQNQGQFHNQTPLTLKNYWKQGWVFRRISGGWQREPLLWSASSLDVFCLVLNLTKNIALLFQEQEFLLQQRGVAVLGEVA